MIPRLGGMALWAPPAAVALLTKPLTTGFYACFPLLNREPCEGRTKVCAGHHHTGWHFPDIQKTLNE